MASDRAWKQFKNFVSRLTLFTGIPGIAGKISHYAGLPIVYVFMISAATCMILYAAWVEVRLFELQKQLQNQKRMIRKRCKNGRKR